MQNMERFLKSPQASDPRLRTRGGSERGKRSRCSSKGRREWNEHKGKGKEGWNVCISVLERGK